MIRIVWAPPRFGLAVGGHVGNDTGWEIGGCVLLCVRSWCRAFIAGWGWDADVPVRPWPRVWWRKQTRRGNVTTGVAWFGFFLNVGQKA